MQQMPEEHHLKIKMPDITVTQCTHAHELLPNAYSSMSCSRTYGNFLSDEGYSEDAMSALVQTQGILTLGWTCCTVGDLLSTQKEMDRIGC